MFSGGHSSISHNLILALRGGSCRTGKQPCRGCSQALHQDTAGSVLAPMYPALLPWHCNMTSAGMQHQTTLHSSLTPPAPHALPGGKTGCAHCCALWALHTTPATAHAGKPLHKPQLSSRQGKARALPSNTFAQAAPSLPRGCFPLPESPAPSPVTLAHSHCGCCRSG